VCPSGTSGDQRYNVIRCIRACLPNIPLGEIFRLEVGYGEALRCRLAQNSQEGLVYERG